MEILKYEDEVIRDMAERMMVKLYKYCDEYSTIITFRAILNPEMKLETLRYFFYLVVCLDNILLFFFKHNIITLK